MTRLFALAILLSLGNPGQPRAHELIKNVSRGDAVVIELLYTDRSPFSYEQFEIYRKGEDVPYQTGRTDALGRIVFVPDREGSWRIRAFSEDGHGIDMTIDAGPECTAEASEHSVAMRTAKIIFGLVVIFAVFMTVLFLIRRRTI